MRNFIKYIFTHIFTQMSELVIAALNIFNNTTILFTSSKSNLAAKLIIFKKSLDS